MEKTHINLVILSPSQEANKLTFSGISTATSIGELRERISAEVGTHPAPARQRLIYRGHALVDAGKTLKDIFTQDIIESSETLSLHLVLPPDPSTQPSSSISTATPSQDQQSAPAQHAHGSFNTIDAPQNPQQAYEGGHASQRPIVQGNIHSQPHIHLHAPGYGHGNAATTHGQFPPQLQQAFAQFHAVNQQLAAQLAAIGTNPMLHGVPPHQTPSQPYQPPALAQPPFQHTTVQQQQTRAATGQHGMHRVPMQNAQMNTSPSPSHIGSSIPPQGNGQGATSTPPATPRNNSTVVRENHGPNGERWQMVIQSGPTGIHNHNGFQNSNATSPHVLNAGLHTPRRMSPALQPNPSTQTTGIGAAAGNTTPSAGIVRPQTPNVALTHLQSNLSTMDAAMAGGHPLPDSVFEQAQEMLRAIPDLSQEVTNALQTRLANLSHNSSHLRENLHAQLIRAAQERAASQRAAQGPESSAVYVLSSPSGPHALLVSPSGFYTAPWQLTSLGAITPHSVVQPTATTPIQHQAAHSNISTNGQQPHVDEVQVAQGQQARQPADPAQVAQVQQQQHVNQARDLARVLLPLGGHLWLLIRLFGFVYFFTAGAGWRRTVLLGLIASLVFIAQTGIFRPIVQGIWDPIRRHAEGLVPLAANERPRAGVGGARDNGDGTGTQPRNRGPTPQEAAERLLQERERQDVSLVRQSLRRVERAVALFVASLVPGVGERHIAAREAAEAARQAEARGREERARKEEDARERQQENVHIGDRSIADGTGEGGESSSAPGQQPAAQPHLEV